MGEILQLLEEHEILYVLAGSVAAALYGADEGGPGDLDVLPATDPRNLERLARVLAGRTVPRRDKHIPRVRRLREIQRERAITSWEMPSWDS